MAHRSSRRRFVQGLAALLTAVSSLPGPLLAAARKTINWRNWGGNQHSQPREILAPKDEQAVIDLLHTTRGQVRPVGSGHSWSALVPTRDTMLTVDRLTGLISHDPDTLQAEVWAGTKLFAFGPMLEQVGQAVMNMSDVNYQSLAGAVATSTHGTGVELGCMSAYVTGLRLITPAGDVVDCSAQRNAELFNAARNSLGSLGVITRLTFQNQQKHRLHQREWLADINEVLEDIDALKDANQQFELFPIPNSNRTVVLVTNPAAEDAVDVIEDDVEAVNELRKAFSLTRKLPMAEEFVYDRMLDFAYGDAKDRIGASYNVLAHPRTVPFIEMEYTVPAEQGVDCLREILATIRRYAPEACFPLEYRYIKRDQTLIGMFSERDGCAISIHEFADEPNWKNYFELIEPVFHKYQGRPHWGKWHSLSDVELSALYPLWADFKRIRRELDPTGRMLNPHLRSLFAEP